MQAKIHGITGIEIGAPRAFTTTEQSWEQVVLFKSASASLGLPSSFELTLFSDSSAALLHTKDDIVDACRSAVAEHQREDRSATIRKILEEAKGLARDLPSFGFEQLVGQLVGRYGGDEGKRQAEQVHAEIDEIFKRLVALDDGAEPARHSAERAFCNAMLDCCKLITCDDASISYHAKYGNRALGWCSAMVNLRSHADTADIKRKGTIKQVAHDILTSDAVDRLDGEIFFGLLSRQLVAVVESGNTNSAAKFRQQLGKVEDELLKQEDAHGAELALVNAMRYCTRLIDEQDQARWTRYLTSATHALGWSDSMVQH